MKTPLMVALLVSLFVRVVAAEAPAYPPHTVANSQVRVLPPTAAGRQYQLHIQLPGSYAANPDRKYPVVYVTDGYWDFEKMVAIRGGLKLIDGFGMHPYSGVAPDDPRSWMMQLEALHERLGELGRPDLTIWLSEYGAPVMASANGYGPALDEQQQAARLRTAYALAMRYDWIENLTWYEFRDSCTDRSDPECRFGVVRADGSRP